MNLTNHALADAQDRALTQEAEAILKANDRSGYTIPTAGLYPYQWNWDSAFTALGLAAFDKRRAWQELETLFTGQWANGMVPHIIFWKPDPGYFPGPEVWQSGTPIPTSGHSQPAVAAYVARRLLGDGTQTRDRASAEILFPQLMAYHRWAHRERDPDGLGLIATTHPWESGRDNARDWDDALARVDPTGIGPYQRRDTLHVDPAMRPTDGDYDRYIALVEYGRRTGWRNRKLAEESPFLVADPGMTFIQMRADRSLYNIARLLGRDKEAEEIAQWLERAHTGIERLWNPAIEAYTALDLRTMRHADCLTSASFLLWFADTGRPERRARMAGHMKRVLSRVSYGVPSLDPDHASFNALGYWRGPVWAVLNAVIAIGLTESGETVLGDMVRTMTRALIRKSSFAEYFDPLNGAPAGGKAFSWTAAVWLFHARPDAGLVPSDPPLAHAP